MNKNTKSIVRLTQLAILVAIMLMFAQIGYIKMPGGVSITLMVLPVAIGAIVLGPIGGAILGGVFGLTSFIQCFLGDPFGAFLLGLNPIFTFIMCFIPRVLCGLLTGIIFKLISKIDKTKIASYFIASFSTAFLNTVLFIGALVLLFWHNSEFNAVYGGNGLWAFIVASVALNGVIEAAVNFIVAGAVAKAIHKLVKIG